MLTSLVLFTRTKFFCRNCERMVSVEHEIPPQDYEGIKVDLCICQCGRFHSLSAAWRGGKLRVETRRVSDFLLFDYANRPIKRAEVVMDDEA